MIERNDRSHTDQSGPANGAPGATHEIPRSADSKGRKAKISGKKKDAGPAELPGVPADIRTLLHPRPLIQGEIPSEYDAILTTLADFLAPKDVVEWMWTQDIADYIWEARRLMRFRDEAVNRAMEHALKNAQIEALIRASICEDANNLDDELGLARWKAPVYREAFHNWMWGSKGMAIELRTLMREAKLNVDARGEKAMAFVNMLETVERFQRLIDSGNQRRDAALREIERRRQGVGRRLRIAADEIVDAEFQRVGRPPILTAEVDE